MMDLNAVQKTFQRMLRGRSPLVSGIDRKNRRRFLSRFKRVVFGLVWKLGGNQRA